MELKPEGATELEVQLQPGGSLAFHLTCAAGHERHSVELEVMLEGDPDATRTERASLGGELVLNGLRQGATYAVTVRSRCRASRASPCAVAPGQAQPIEIRLEH